MNAPLLISAFATVLLLGITLEIARTSERVWLCRTIAGIELVITTIAGLTLPQPYGFIFAIAAMSILFVAVRSFSRTA